MAIIQDAEWRCTNRELHGKGPRPQATWVVRDVNLVGSNLLLRCDTCLAQVKADADNDYQVAALLTPRVRRTPQHDLSAPTEFSIGRDNQHARYADQPAPQPAD